MIFHTFGNKENKAIMLLHGMLTPWQIWEDAVSVLSANVVAMVYIPFALWVLEKAKKQGVKRLYFLSRDCYIIMKAAAVFAKDYDVDIKYLFVSRRCLYLPYIAGGTEIEYLEAADKHTIIRRDNVNKLLLHLGTSRDELKNIYSIDFPYQRTDTQEEQQDFLEKILYGTGDKKIDFEYQSSATSGQ